MLKATSRPTTRIRMFVGGDSIVCLHAVGERSALNWVHLASENRAVYLMLQYDRNSWPHPRDSVGYPTTTLAGPADLRRSQAPDWAQATTYSAAEPFRPPRSRRILRPL